MPGDYRVDHARATAVLTISGPPLSWAEFVSLVDRMIDEPDFQAGMTVIEDVRHLEGAPPADCMRAMVGLFKSRADRLAGARWAMVVGAGRSALYGVGRMAEILAEDSPVAFSVFQHWDEAEAWLASPAVAGDTTTAPNHRPRIG